MLRNLYLLRIFRMFQKYPKASFLTAGVVCLPFVHLGLTFRAKRIRNAPIDSTLKAGTPLFNKFQDYMDRSTLIESITKKFIHSNMTESFGIILGPTGTGKTYVTQKACEGKRGVIYLEVELAEVLGVHLARAIGMRTEPTGIIGLGLSYLSDKYTHHYRLPEDNTKAVQFVIEKLAERAVEYRRKHGHLPSLFIDGIDIVAKFDDTLFTKLVVLAKKYSNENQLQIVFVSSEGHIIPLMQKTSSSSRAMSIVEVMDVCDDQAKDFLIKKGMPENLAINVVKLTGGRLIHLLQAHRVYIDTAFLAEDNQMRAIESVLYTRVVQHSMMSLRKNYELGKEVINHIVENGDADPNNSIFASEDMERTIKCLVEANVLRYTVTGKLSWHNKLIRNAALDYLQQVKTK